MSLPPLHHRTSAFEKILDRVQGNLRFLFQTEQPVYTLAASGTGAMEATVTNLFAAGDEVLVVNAGKFGERWTKIALRYGLKVHEIKVEWGHAVDPDKVEQFVRAHAGLRGVLFQASETSTGVMHPVKAVASRVRAHSEALICVDAITALGVCPLPMDEWGLDVVVSGSQKALMLPPGLAFLSLSARAQLARKRADLATFYFDLKAEDRAMASGQTAWTPAVSLIAGLDVVLQRLRERGLAPVFQHHARLAEGTRRGVQALGLKLFAQTSPADSVTAVRVPSEIPDGKKILSYLRDHFAITVAEGQDAFQGKMFRLAHLGYFDELDMLTVLCAVEITLKQLGYPLELGRGVGAAAQYFTQNAKE
jgi:aspartate aminotransferase-like enzyme